LSRIYGAANPGLTWQLTNGSLVNGDTLSGALATVATTTSDVGDYAIAQGTLDAGGNYALSFNSGTLTIDPKTLTLGLTGTVDKTYDGTADATLALANYSGLGFVSGDTVQLAGYAAGSYADKNAGTGKTVTVSGLTLSGPDAGNYQLASADVSGNIGTIDPKSLTVTAENDRVTYDGTAYAGGNGVTYAGFVSGENETDLNGTLVYGGASQGAQDAGTYAITASGLVSANYDIAFAPGTLVIDPKTLTPGLTGSVSKTYDGTAAATLALTNYTGLGFVAGDTVALSGYANGAYADKNAGTGKKVSVSGLALTGADAGNYRLASSSVSNTIGVITPAPLTVTAKDDSKVYDGNAYAGGNGVTYSGFAGSDDASDLSGSIAYGGTAQGAVNVGGYTLTVSGLSSSNYDISFAPGTLTISAAALDLSITPQAASKIYGDTLSLTQFDASGLAGSDAISGVTLTSPGTVATADAGSYDIAVSNAVFSSGSASNYVIHYHTLTDGLSVTPRAITVTAGNLSR
ncbi:MAG: YDG domain-containing protein, partial [Nitratireductor sp.]